MKTTLRTTLAFMILLLAATTLFASTNTSLYIGEIEYKENGSVRIVFSDNTTHVVKVRWSNKESLNVYDRIGNKVIAQITWRGQDSLEVYVPFARINETYMFELAGMHYGGKPVAFSGYFSVVPGWRVEYREPLRVRRQIAARNMHESLYISDVRYLDGDLVRLTFGLRDEEPEIAWDGTERVSIEGRYGLFSRILSRKYELDGIVVQAEALQLGEPYFIEIRGIPYRGQRISLGAEFVADETWRYRLERMQ